MSTYLNRDAEDGWPGDGETPKPGYIDEFIQKNRAVVSSAPPPDLGADNPRYRLSWALSAYGRWMKDAFGEENAHLLPINAIKGVKHFPPTAICHGDADEAVHVNDSRKFRDKLIEVLGEEFKNDVHLEVLPGLDHGFDCPSEPNREPEKRRHHVREEEAWMQRMLDFVEKRWLGGGS
jgi:dienelactone hydrolase